MLRIHFEAEFKRCRQFGSNAYNFKFFLLFSLYLNQCSAPFQIQQNPFKIRVNLCSWLMNCNYSAGAGCASMSCHRRVLGNRSAWSPGARLEVLAVPPRRLRCTVAHPPKGLMLHCTVPMATTHQPCGTAGRDGGTGDDGTGWGHATPATCVIENSPGPRFALSISAMS